MIVTSASSVVGHGVMSTAGLVQGSIVHAIPGGLEMLTRAHDQAIERMIRNAQTLGANAVLDVRFNTARVMDSLIEVLAYGNAVLLDT